MAKGSAYSLPVYSKIFRADGSRRLIIFSSIIRLTGKSCFSHWCSRNMVSAISSKSNQGRAAPKPGSLLLIIISLTRIFFSLPAYVFINRFISACDESDKKRLPERSITSSSEGSLIIVPCRVLFQECFHEPDH